jgi:class 3 adenylate cyclase
MSAWSFISPTEGLHRKQLLRKLHPHLARVSLALIFGLERDVPRDRLADTEEGVSAARCEDGRMSGAPLPRGTVTFLFSDIEGSTDLLRLVGDHTFAAIRTELRRLLRNTFAEHEGREIDTAGDGFFAAFDSAQSAVAAAVASQLALATFTWADAEVRVRMGLHTAEPHLDEDGYVGVGVHRAARICNAAHGGQILISNATAGIIEDAGLTGVVLLDLGEHQLKGLPRDQRLFQLSVLTLPSKFGPPRTAETDAQTPGAGTFVHTDLSGWRHAIRVLGDEASATLIADYHGTVTTEVKANNGVVLELSGDHVLAVFRSASDAARAAAAVREALRESPWPPECDVAVSIVLHSGSWSGNPQRPAAGTALSRLIRFAKVVEPGQVLVSQATAALLEGDRRAPALRSLGERAIPDFDEPAHVYELVESH